MVASILRHLLTVLLFCSAGNVLAATDAEYQLKAAFLYRFAQFVEWPTAALDRTDTALPICVMGAEEIGNALADIEGKVVNGRPISVLAISDATSINRCLVLFVGSQAARGSLAQVLKNSHQNNVLTVSDTEDFSSDGGIIGFVLIGTRLGFEINTKSARSAGLNLSSHLLKLARTVR